MPPSPTVSSPTRLTEALALVHATPIADGARSPGLFLYGLQRVPASAWEALSRFCGELPEATARLRVPVDGELKVVKRSGRLLELPGALGPLAALPDGAGTGSLRVWSLAAKLALELTCAERIVPVLHRTDDQELHAQWQPALRPEDVGRIDALARALPPAGHADAAGAADPRRAVESFVQRACDSIARAATRAAKPRSAWDDTWPERLRFALTSTESGFVPGGFYERRLPDDLADWTEPAFDGARDGYRAGFRVRLPEDDETDRWHIEYLLQAADDPSLVIGADVVWSDHDVVALGRLFPRAQEGLLRALGRAARLFAPIGDSLQDADPTGVDISTEDAWIFLTDVAPVLQSGGYVVLLPAELTASGRRRLRLRMRVDVPGQSRRRSDLDGGLHADGLAAFRWEAAIGDRKLTRREYDRIVAAKRPLVRVRGQWVVLDPSEVARMDELVGTSGTMPAAQAAALTLTGVAGDAEDEVVAGPGWEAVLGALHEAESAPDVEPPAALAGELRPYQLRGLGWLEHLEGAGFGGVLADDMGLGKTIQVIAAILSAQERNPRDDAPTLVVCPTSVVGNWEREIRRFAPKLAVVIHHGLERSRNLEALTARLQPHAVVLTSYGLMRRDAKMLGQVPWSRLVLDEAQNIKNPDAKQSRAARALPARRRVALTGTPVENRLSDLWSIMQFANPGLLGSEKAFRERYGLPVERYGDAEAAERLRTIIRPFVLRRVKTDPTIAPDLPEKLETTTYCALTPEQATLYQAVVDEMLTDVEQAEGIERRGRILALLTALKQICDHPALYLHETEPIEGRSGKLARIVEMLEEVRDEGDAALVFTQYASMGRLLVSHLRDEFGAEPLFLHGGTPRKARERMIEQFSSPGGPDVFVLSLKAGGVGLNLTRASHVFHYDRWWNPAVEDQATDRAYRIGQTRTVLAHTLLVAGTLEERIAELIEKKRALAGAVVGAGEGFLTELGNAELRELVSLSATGVRDDDERRSTREAIRR